MKTNLPSPTLCRSALLGTALLLVSMASCQKSNFKEDLNVAPRSLETVVDPPNSPTLSMSDLSSMFTTYVDSHISKTDKGEIEEIIPILSDNSSDTLMYAINYRNGGYLILSSTRNYAPIIATSETGRYVIGDNPGIEIMLAMTKQVILLQKQKPDSTIAAQSRLQWLAYEKRKAYPIASTKSAEEVYTLIDISLAKWRSEGYEVYMLRDFIDPSNYSFDQDLKNLANQQSQYYANRSYDRATHAFVLVKTLFTEEFKNTLLKTDWHQEAPFNTYAPVSIWGGKYYIGCVNVAVAQIMAYHRYPSNYSWSAMVEDNNSEQLASFFRDVHQATGSQPDLFSLSMNGTDQGAQRAFESFGYTSMGVQSYNFGYVAASLTQNRPVYLGGFNPKGEGHAWVSDGYETRANGTVVVLQVLEDCPDSYTPQAYYPIELRRITDYYTHQLHMNWGWGTGWNGWYTPTNFPEKVNFSTKMTMIAHIKPNV